MAAGRRKATRKKASAKKTTRKKVARKKTTAKKATRKKVTAKKTARKKDARKKGTAKKTGRGGKVAKPAESAAPQVVSATEGAKIAAGVPTRIGAITHYFGRVGAGVISLESGELRVGDTIHVRGHTTDFYQRVNRIEIDHAQVEIAKPGQSVGVEITQRVREHDEVFKVSD